MHLSHNFRPFRPEAGADALLRMGRGPRQEWDEFKDQVVFAVVGEDADAAGYDAALQVR